MQKFVEKMIAERGDLEGKIKRARKAVENPPFGSDEKGLSMLSEQLKCMEGYLSWLEKRIDREAEK